MREVPGEKVIVDGDLLDGNDGLAEVEVEDTGHEEEGVPVGKDLHHAVDVHHWLQVGDGLGVEAFGCGDRFILGAGPDAPERGAGGGSGGDGGRGTRTW